MSAPCVSACTPWATVDDICTPCDDYTFPTGLLDDMIAVATDLLYELSGRQFPGSCQDTVRPCAQGVLDNQFPRREVGSFAWPIVGANGVRASCGCSSRRQCGCPGVSEITLGGAPLTAIDEVKIDGVVLDPSLYRIDDYRYLVKLPDAEGNYDPFPCCQNIRLADTEADTFAVTFTYGTPPPTPGVLAAAQLACELALACSPETIGKCRLPQRVTSIARQGITMAVLDPFDFLSDGKTGLYLVDLFLRTYNPNRLRRRAAVLSPDVGRKVRRITG